MTSPPRPLGRGLSFLVQGPPKSGKSSFASTVPAPRAILDSESGSYWTHSGRKIEWDPSRGGPPEVGRHVTAGYGQPSVTPGWDTAMVVVHKARVLDDAYRWLSSGRHPFNGVASDSHTELQQRYVDELAGQGQMRREHWGSMLRSMNSMTRGFRDLLTNPVKQVWGICFICGSHWDTTISKWRPLLQGQSKDYQPYYIDILGAVQAQPNGQRLLLIGPNQFYETGERVGGRLPDVMPLAYPAKGIQGWDIASMIQKVNQS